MPPSGILSQNAYGKSQVRLTKVTRRPDVHELKELSVDIQLEGSFQASYTDGDNSKIIATDTMKNTVYAVARNHPLPDAETFGKTLGRHFVDRNAHVDVATVVVSEHLWHRIPVGGAPHPHAFVSGGSEARTATVRTDRKSGVSVRAGITGLLVLKTTDSAFTGYLKDEFTTLKETDDRIFATSVTADWSYKTDTLDFDKAHAAVRKALLEVFAVHKSLAVQQTLHDMGLAALDACPEIAEIKLTMPNQHRLLMDLRPFGLDNPNEIFVPTSEPYGLITGTLKRA